MKLRPRHIWIGIAILVLVPILVPLITLGGAKTKILRALQAGLGRRIEAGEIHLVAFPLPGVELDQVRLGEDPRFGAEDMVVADSATAAIRFSSLFSGRLAFARIQLERPSINLVRNSAGQWNIAALLDRTGQGPASRGVAPLRPSVQFPYLVWSDARINFKLNQTKTRFYLDQVQGSLAHDSGGWRLQARFQPARTDLNLSDTGEVTVDGRWPSAQAGAGFPQQPFDLALRVQNSFLAGSSALLVGHDAGVHGILSAEIHVHGTGQDFLMGGTLQAQAVRRWDLLPPPVTVRASFSGTYYPAEERFHLDGLGDRGFQQLRLAGDVRNLFTRPDASLTLQLHRYAAGNLIALVRAVKANLPADLALEGAVQGDGTLRWARGGVPQGRALITLEHPQLTSGDVSLEAPALALRWDGRTLTLPAAAATLVRNSGGSSPGTALNLSLAMDRAGFRVQVASPALDGAGAARLSRLFGMRSPWPPELEGSSTARLQLAAPWHSFRNAGWSGEVRFAHAVFHPAGASLSLRNVDVTLADPAPRRATLVALVPDGPVPAPVAVSLSWGAGAEGPLQFGLRAGAASSAGLWQALHPNHTDSLVERVLGDVTGSTTPASWLGGVRGSGTVSVERLDWHHIDAGLRMNVTLGARQWEIHSLILGLAGGRFRGDATLQGSRTAVSGVVDPKAPIALALLFSRSPYRGLVSGQLQGSLQLVRPVSEAPLNQVHASGQFDVRSGTLATSTGPVRFTRFAAAYDLQQGTGSLQHVVWVSGGERWEGKGSFQVDGEQRIGYQLDLTSGALHRRLVLAPGAPQ